MRSRPTEENNQQSDVIMQLQMFAYISQIGVPAAQLGEPLVCNRLSSTLVVETVIFNLSDHAVLSFVLLSIEARLKRSTREWTLNVGGVRSTWLAFS